jgi:hypothetical protein
MSLTPGTAVISLSTSATSGVSLLAVGTGHDGAGPNETFEPRETQLLQSTKMIDVLIREHIVMRGIYKGTV